MLQSNVVVDHIAHFTAQRDQELLSLSLLQSVNNMLSSSSSMIVTMDKRGNVLSSNYSKNNGRNKVTFYEEMLASGEVLSKEIEEGDIELF